MTTNAHVPRNPYAGVVSPYGSHVRKSLNLTQKQLTDPNDLLGQVLSDRYRLAGIVGSGPYSVVYSAFDLIFSEMVAIKMIAKCGKIADILHQDRPRPRSLLPESYRNIHCRNVPLDQLHLHYSNLVKSGRFNTKDPLHVAYREAALHSLACNAVPEGVVTVRQVMDSANFLYMVMDFYPADLFHAITDLKFYSDDERSKKVFLQILDAVQACHDHSIYHCDLKPENFLVNNDGSIVKLTDFGLSTSTKICHDYGCGSNVYMSPERRVQSSGNHSGFSSAQCDIWALGVILLNITCGRNPWKKAEFDDPSFLNFTRDYSYLTRILPITLETSYILGRIFTVNPEERPTLATIRKLVVECTTLTGPDTTAHNSLQSVKTSHQEQVERFERIAQYTRNARNAQIAHNAIYTQHLQNAQIAQASNPQETQKTEVLHNSQKTESLRGAERAASPSKPSLQEIPTSSTVSSTLSASSYYATGSPNPLQMSPYVHNRTDSPMAGVLWTPSAYQIAGNGSYLSPTLNNDGFDSPLFNNGEYFPFISRHKRSNPSSVSTVVCSSAATEGNNSAALISRPTANKSGLLPALPLRQHGADDQSSSFASQSCKKAAKARPSPLVPPSKSS